MYKYDLEKEKEYLVKKFEYFWFKDDEESEQSEQNDDENNKDDIKLTEKLNAYCAVFMKVDSSVCETEHDFVQRRMIALLFDSGKGNND